MLVLIVFDNLYDLCIVEEILFLFMDLFLLSIPNIILFIYLLDKVDKIN
jgi:hypothetical protein